MKTIYEKEGNAVVATSAIVSLMVGVGIAVLVLILVGSLGGQTYNLVQSDIDQIANNVVDGEAATILVNETTQLAHPYVQAGSLLVSNASNTAPIGLGNFTIDYDAGTLYLDVTQYNNSDVLFNYTWGEDQIRTEIQGAIVSGFSALESAGGYLPIIVLAVVIALVMALVLGYMAGGFGGGGSGSAL